MKGKIKKYWWAIIIITIIVVCGIYKNFSRVNFLKTLDGEIVYTHRDDGVLNIYKISADGKNKKLLYHNEDKNNSNSMYPRWSKDGTEIYFSAMKDGDWKRFVMNSNGNNVRLSEDTVVSYFNSSSSREIGIIIEKGDIYYDENGKKTQVFDFSPLIYDSELNSGPSEAFWSPNRKYIIFQTFSAIDGIVFQSNGNIMIADKEGRLVKLTRGDDPDWKQ